MFDFRQGESMSAIPLASVREYLNCLGVKVQADIESGVGEGTGIIPSAIRLTTACRVVAMFVGVPAIANDLYVESIKYGKEVMHNGEDWRRQLALLESYDTKFSIPKR